MRWTCGKMSFSIAKYDFAPSRVRTTIHSSPPGLDRGRKTQAVQLQAHRLEQHGIQAAIGFLVAGKHAHYLFTVKANQPGRHSNENLGDKPTEAVLIELKTASN